MSLSCRCSKDLPVPGRKRIVGQDLSGPAEMNISIKSAERGQLNSVVIPVDGVAELCLQGKELTWSSAVRNVGQGRISLSSGLLDL